MTRHLSLLVAIALFAFSPLTSAAMAGEARLALVMGNGNYGPAIGKLKNPVNDAKLIASTMKSLGFSVELVIDADQKAMKRAIKAFGAKLRDAGTDATGFFYYAGHGIQVEGENFLLPIDAEVATEADVEIESVSADDVMTQLAAAGNAVNLVFLDACRNNPLARTGRSASRGLARLDAPRGSFVGYSTAPGDIAADGDGANSPYAIALASELKRPGISVEEAHRNVRARVLTTTSDRQTPWDSSSLTGPVILGALPPSDQAKQAVLDQESVFWTSIAESDRVAEYEAYLKQYPNGAFASLAKERIAAITAAPGEQQQAAVGTSDGAATLNRIERLIADDSSRFEKDVAAFLVDADQLRSDAIVGDLTYTISEVGVDSFAIFAKMRATDGSSRKRYRVAFHVAIKDDWVRLYDLIYLHPL